MKLFGFSFNFVPSLFTNCVIYYVERQNLMNTRLFSQIVLGVHIRRTVELPVCCRRAPVMEALICILALRPISPDRITPSTAYLSPVARRALRTAKDD